MTTAMDLLAAYPAAHAGLNRAYQQRISISHKKPLDHRYLGAFMPFFTWRPGTNLAPAWPDLAPSGARTWRTGTTGWHGYENIHICENVNLYNITYIYYSCIISLAYTPSAGARTLTWHQMVPGGASLVTLWCQVVTDIHPFLERNNFN